MSAVVEQVFETPVGKYLVDPYENWAAAEGVPIHRGAALDLLAAETALWQRFGARGALCHLDGRCDFLTIFLLELAPGRWTEWQHHLYEEVCLVVSGEGETEIDLGEGRMRTMAWTAGALLSAPMNARYRHRSTTGSPARLACVNDMRYLLNLYRNEAFLFDNPLSFPERGNGDLVSDLAVLPVASGRSLRDRTTSLSLAHGSIGADIVELLPGTYGTARRQMFGSLLFGIAGKGETLTFADPQDAPIRHGWQQGMVYAPAGLSFHQHFNMGSEPARYLRIEFGSQSYPILRPRKRAYGDTSVYASGNAEIDHSQESADLRAHWEKAIGEVGVQSRM